MGFIDFTAGDKPTAAQFDEMFRQGIMKFATTGARDSALSGVLSAGLPCYVTATQCFYIYDGSTWQVYGWPLVAGETAVSVSIGGNTDDTSAGSLTDWLTVSLTVPAWAGRAKVRTFVNGLFEATSGGNSYTYRTRVGSTNGETYATEGQGLSTRFSLVYMDMLTGISTGSQTFGVQTNRTAGSGRFRVDTSSKCKFDVTFLP